MARAEPVDQAERQQQRRIGFFGRVFELPIRALGVLMLSLFFSLVMEWIGIAFFYPEQGYTHAQQMMEQEMGYFSSGFRHSLLHSQPVVLASGVVQNVYEWAFVKTGFMAFAEQARQPIPAEAGHVQRYSLLLFRVLEDYLLAAMYTSLTFITRVMILLLSMPLFGLAGMVGFVDGLVRRDLRRFGAGLESSFWYHHIKRWVVPSFVLVWIVYLSLPFSVHPNVVLLPCSALFGLIVSLTVGQFKKYF
ncbi:TIGR03747 family integrating conjugative element membrane protein [Pokkaliibacter sp. MBI-7]|uniref:TIGR03747 family integrating conjugative element membrane protein n=1 Tax=Pokkaliibacter sp. MBI-7 TaxID=3040600 RepID=UPI00244C6DAA|nr:TIGR03747 family integrating conjugative element membrane protein [Pokkaliibacter sp. MBI-7]MDH2436658.1 TIGR03747 family integrating conjugative element membrane protein [Pokkaliibacter sp. MBI-7]